MYSCLFILNIERHIYKHKLDKESKINLTFSAATNICVNNLDIYYPCLCLCLGFSQITLITPFLLMILHLSHIFFTDGLTFISKAPP